MVRNGPTPTCAGPLSGLNVVEIGSIGRARLRDAAGRSGHARDSPDRVSGAGSIGPDADFRAELLPRGRRSIAVDLAHPDGAEVVLSFAEGADVT